MAEKLSSGDEIYQRLVDESDESWLFGLLSFAVVEEQRIEWAKHFAENNGKSPDANEIRTWYEQQPESVLLRAKGTAESALQTFSSEVLEAIIEEYGDEIEEGIIVSEIRSRARFWPQFGISVAGGFTGALLFTAFVVIVAFLALNDTSPVQVIEGITK